MCVLWRPHWWFDRSRAIGKHQCSAGVQAFTQRIIFFDHPFFSGDCPRVLMTFAFLEQLALWVAFQCSF